MVVARVCSGKFQMDGLCNRYEHLLVARTAGFLRETSTGSRVGLELTRKDSYPSQDADPKEEPQGGVQVPFQRYIELRAIQPAA